MTRPSVAIITLGCARNEVDSEELAAELDADGWDLTEDPAAADTVVVNTCGFIEAAKRESIDTILAASELPGRVVAVGCLAERYGEQLAESMPEADAVLGFDTYPEIPGALRKVMAGQRVASHTPSDRRRLLPVAPTDRSGGTTVLPGHVGLRRRLEDGPFASVKLASGCDRRCSFCAIPSFRGAFVSRRPADVANEISWLADNGVLEVNLVSENSTSYGKDLGDLRLLESLLTEVAGSGVVRLRVAYLQPAEMRPELVRVIAGTPGVAPYFDMSFQHANADVLRRMRRFGGTRDFLRLVEQIRSVDPDAAIRSNDLVGDDSRRNRRCELWPRSTTWTLICSLSAWERRIGSGCQALRSVRRLRHSACLSRNSKWKTLCCALAGLDEGYAGGSRRRWRRPGPSVGVSSKPSLMTRYGGACGAA